MNQPGWHFWIDRGGTFTDVIACSPQGTLQTWAVQSDNNMRLYFPPTFVPIFCCH